MATLGDWLHQQALSAPEQIGMIAGDQAWNFRTMDQATDRLAARLLESEAGPNVHIGVLLPNSPEYVLLVHALARVGAVLVPLNTRQTPSELSWQLSEADCALLIYNSETKSQDEQLETSDLSLVNLDLLSVNPKPVSERPDNQPAKATKRKSTSIPAFNLQLDTVQAIVFTSGTTGRPKGAQLTYGNHLWSAAASAFRLGVSPDDRWLVTLPFYHVGGLSIIFRSALYGTALVLQTGFNPQEVLEAIERHKITLISLVPTMLYRLLEQAGGSQTLARLRCILVGGAGIAPPLLERSLAAGLNIALTYGMTETASQIATASPEQTRSHQGSVGKPLALCQVRILDEDGNELPAGEIGQIAVSGPVVMKGYYKQEQTLNGELRSGDLGYLDSRGDLWVVQRRGDLIISGGEKIIPSEVEAVLLTHPQVENACVIGLDHPEWGQQAAAAIVLKPGREPSELEMIEFCRGKLAGYKIPRRVCFVEQLPQTASGKIKRKEVEQVMRASLSYVNDYRN